MSQPACPLGMPCFLDFEASSLSGDSYPIQVAWSDTSGHIECHLIRPEPDWTDWDEHSEEAHGLERERVVSEGMAAAEICRRMNAALAGQTVLTDALSMDRFWLLRLFEAGNRMPSFRLADITPLLQQRLSLEGEAAQYHIQRLQSRAWHNVPGHAHRADHDVSYLMELWRLTGKD